MNTLAVLVTQSLDWAEGLVIAAAVAFVIAVALSLFNKQWPKASVRSPLFVAIGLLLFALAFLFGMYP